MARRVRQLSPELGKDVLRAWERLAAGMSVGKMEAVIAAGGVDALFDEVLNDALLERAFAQVEQRFTQQAVDNMAFFAKDYGIGFGVLDPKVIDSIRALDLKMATSLKDDVRETVRAFVENGLRNGMNPRTIARQTRQVVGLTGKQLEWVDNFRNELETSSKKALRRSLGRGFIRLPDGSVGYNAAHAGGIGVRKTDMATLRRVLGTDEKLSPKQVDRMVDAYRRRLTALHSEAIARTATLDSLKNAQHQATDQAIKQGVLNADRMWSEWVTAGDDRVRDAHVAMAGDKVPFGTEFKNGQTIPGSSDYMCRCSKRDYLGKYHGQGIPIT